MFSLVYIFQHQGISEITKRNITVSLHDVLAVLTEAAKLCNPWYKREGHTNT